MEKIRYLFICKTSSHYLIEKHEMNDIKSLDKYTLERDYRMTSWYFVQLSNRKLSLGLYKETNVFCEWKGLIFVLW